MSFLGWGVSVVRTELDASTTALQLGGLPLTEDLVPSLHAARYLHDPFAGARLVTEWPCLHHKVSGHNSASERPIGGVMSSRRRYPETVPMLVASAIAVAGFIWYVVMDGLWR